MIGRSVPLSKQTDDATRNDANGIYLTYLQRYPGYTGVLQDSVSGVVTVGQLDTETTVLQYELFGLETGAGKQGGLHIHTGTSCATADKVGGHYWNTNTLVPDPWTPMKHNPSTIARTSSGSMNVVTGLALHQVRAIKPYYLGVISIQNNERLF